MGKLRDNAKPYMLPPPIGGWNLRDPLYAMPETDAQIIDNIVPEPGYCRTIGGLLQLAGYGINTRAQTLMSFALNDGTEKLVVILRDAGGTFYFLDHNTTTNTYSTISYTAAITITNWQYAVFRHRLFFVNGFNVPKDWTGTGAINDTAWTGSGLTPADLVNVATYNSRLYFVEKNSSNLWYGGVDTVTGTLTKFNPESILQLGGSILWAGECSRSGYDSNQNLFVIYTNMGEVLVYSGTYPADASWTIVFHGFIGRPGSVVYPYRCAFYVGTELMLITADGPISVQSLLGGVDTNDDYTVVAGKVRPGFNVAAIAANQLQMWQGIYYPYKHYVLINIPTTNTNSQQYGYNTITKAWFRLRNFNIDAWVVHKNELITTELFPTAGTVLCKFDQMYQNGEDNAAISWELKQAYSFLGAPVNEKELAHVQPYISLQYGSGGPAQDTLQIGFDYDFEDGSSGALETPFLNIDSSAAKFNKLLLNASGSAKAFALRMLGSSTSRNLKHFATWVYYKVGGEAT